MIDYLTVTQARSRADLTQSLFTASPIGSLLLTLHAIGALVVGVLIWRRALLLHLELAYWGAAALATIVLVICVSVVVH